MNELQCCNYLEQSLQWWWMFCDPS